jgi:hypothetical protein
LLFPLACATPKKPLVGGEPGLVALEVYRGFSGQLVDATTAPPGDEASPRASGPGPSALRLSPPEPTFRVEAASPDDPDAPARILAEGRAGAEPVQVAPGLVELALDLEPPERIGPFQVAPGSRTRVRVLDYPRADPPTRIWRVEREGSTIGSSFPPLPRAATPEESTR